MSDLNDIYIANALTTLAASDLVYIYEDPGGVDADAGIDKADLFAQIMDELLVEYGSNTVWDSTTGYHVEPGMRRIEGATLEWSSNITKAGLSPTNNTLYYIYLYDNSGTAAVEESTTVPVWNTTYLQWVKTGDTSRRCINYYVSDLAGNTIRKFLSILNGSTIENIGLDGLMTTDRRVLAAGSQTGSWTSVDVSTFVPLQATHSYMIPKIGSASAGDEATLGISPIDLSAVVAGNAPWNFRGSIEANNDIISPGGVWFPISTAQTHYYRLADNTGTGGVAYIECDGARFNI